MAWIKIVAFAFDYSLRDLGTVYFRLEGESGPRSTGAISADKFNAISNVLKAGPSFFENQLFVFRSTSIPSTRIESNYGMLTSEDIEQAKTLEL